MQPANILPLVMLALLQWSNAGTVVPRQSSESGSGSECDIAGCITSLGTLPLPIVACASAASDLGKLNTTDFNLGETIGEGADCLAEASHAIQELPEKCGGCITSALSLGG